MYYMQTFMRLSFAIRMHAICISDKSLLHLQWHAFNRNEVASKTKFSYTVVITKWLR